VLLFLVMAATICHRYGDFSLYTKSAKAERTGGECNLVQPFSVT